MYYHRLSVRYTSLYFCLFQLLWHVMYVMRISVCTNNINCIKETYFSTYSGYRRNRATSCGSRRSRGDGCSMFVMMMLPVLIRLTLLRRRRLSRWTATFTFFRGLFLFLVLACFVLGCFDGCRLWRCRSFRWCLLLRLFRCFRLGILIDKLFLW